MNDREPFQLPYSRAFCHSRGVSRERSCHCLVRFRPQSVRVSFDDYFRLKHTDPQSSLFGGLKWPEQGVLQKVRAHAASVVRDGKNGMAVLLARRNDHLRSLSRSFRCIEEQIRHDTGICSGSAKTAGP